MTRKNESEERPVPEVYFPKDGSAEWLAKTDAFLTAMILSQISHSPNQSRFDVLEIGVWKGAWTSVVLQSQPTVTVIGIDPYPGTATAAREVLAQRMRNLGLMNRFQLFSDRTDVPEGLYFSLAHIDGVHTESAVFNDLVFALERLAPGGVIIVDDFRHPHFPGIASALFRFCEQNDTRIFLTSPDKAYMSRIHDAPNLYDQAIADAGRFRVRIERFWGDVETAQLGSDDYPQPTDVLGQPVLIALGTIKPTAAEAEPDRLSVLRALTSVVIPLAPPILLSLLRAFYSRLATLANR